MTVCATLDFAAGLEVVVVSYVHIEHIQRNGTAARAPKVQEETRRLIIRHRKMMLFRFARQQIVKCFVVCSSSARCLLFLE